MKDKLGLKANLEELMFHEKLLLTCCSVSYKNPEYSREDIHQRMEKLLGNKYDESVKAIDELLDENTLNDTCPICGAKLK